MIAYLLAQANQKESDDLDINRMNKNTHNYYLVENNDK